MRAIAAGLSDVGKQRAHNEDRFILLPEFSVFVVADGMGGHQSGEVASRMAASTIAAYFRGKISTPPPAPPPAAPVDEPGITSSAPSTSTSTSTRDTSSTSSTSSTSITSSTPSTPPPSQGPVSQVSPMPSPDSVSEKLRTAITHANARIFARADDSRIHRGMGTTVVAAAFARDGQAIHVVHAGDSRCYRLRDGELTQLTRDHSLVSDALLERPDLSSQDLAYLPKNVITRALGIAPTVDVDFRTEEVRVGDVFLLCSDGLHGFVSDADICETLVGEPVLTEACARLIDLANAVGGKDNITAVVVRIEDEDEPWSRRTR